MTVAQGNTRTLLIKYAFMIVLVLGANVNASEKIDLPNHLSNQTKYKLFEVGQVRPLIMSRNGEYLYAANTPDDRVEIFSIGAQGIEYQRSVSVGMRPVALGEASTGELWVVNHLSDNISIVDVERGEVINTLWVGDEPRDIVFAGDNYQRAFITTAHRGQNSPLDPQLNVPGVGRADVWVFDSGKVVTESTPSPEAIVTLFADTPRALAVSPDGTKVYAAAFRSGNQTTAIHEFAMEENTEVNIHGESQPTKGIIAKYINGAWIDILGNDVSGQINFNLPDHDVFTIDAMASTPVEIAGPGSTFSHVGTTLFNMTVNPKTGALYVANTEANNFTRFEGPGLDPVVNTTVRGNIVQSRITLIKDNVVNPIHLNKHIDYSQCCAPPGNAEARKSLAFPQQMVVSKDGNWLFVAAFGSAKVGVFNVAELEQNTFVPSEQQQIALNGGGPAGLALDEERQRLYVLTRFNNSIEVIDLNNKSSLQQVAMFSPEPESVVQGRRFLYDALYTSSHGDSACASCHVDGDTDHLAWDLGDPTLKAERIPGSLLASTGVSVLDFFTDTAGIETSLKGTPAFAQALPDCQLGKIFFDPVRFFGVPVPCSEPRVFHFSSNKGPMVTQTLAGMDNHGPMHWRGDRAGGSYEIGGIQPNDGIFNERTAFKKFNGAFPGLIGRDKELTETEMELFTDFVLQSTLPPNPVRNLDNSLTPMQAMGEEIYFGGPKENRATVFIRTCNECHTLDPVANQDKGVEHPGFFGTDGRYSFVFTSEMFKVPHLRNMYQKVGMFTMHSPANGLMGPKNARMIKGFPFIIPEHKGDQIRGFGFTHDGAIGTMAQFYQIAAFVNLGEAKNEVIADFVPGIDPGNVNVIADILIPANSGGFLPYVEPGTWSSDENDFPEGYKYLAKTNDPFFSQINPATGQPVGMEELDAIEQFSFVFPTNMAPAVGQQVTVTTNLRPDAINRAKLLEQQAQKSLLHERCDLVVKSTHQGEETGRVFDPVSRRYLDGAGKALYIAELLAEAPLTFSCVPPGDGVRVALDRDGDLYSDTVELAAGTYPNDSSSYPQVTSPPVSAFCRWFPFLCK